VSRVLHDFYELDPQKVGFYAAADWMRDSISRPSTLR